MREEHTQYPQKVNVWKGIVGNHIIGPFFIERNLNGDHYLALFQNDVILTLANLHPDPAKLQVPVINKQAEEQKNPGVYHKSNKKTKKSGGTEVL